MMRGWDCTSNTSARSNIYQYIYIFRYILLQNIYNSFSIITVRTMYAYIILDFFCNFNVILIEQRNKKLTYGYPGATLYIFRLLYMAAGELIHVYTPLHGVHCVRFHFTAVSGKFGSSNCTGLGFSVILFTSKHGRHFLTRLFGAHGAGQTGFRIISNRNHKIDFTLTHTNKQHNKSFKHRSTRRNSSSTILLYIGSGVLLIFL